MRRISSNFSLHHARNGFTLVEFLMFAALFVIAILTFIGVLITVVRIQARQNAAAEVTQEAQFLVQTFQRYIEDASIIELERDNPSSFITLRMASSTADPRVICLGGTPGPHACNPLENYTLFFSENDGTPQPLTSARVAITNLKFTRIGSFKGHDAVRVEFTIQSRTQNPQQFFSQTIQTTIARSSPAIFNETLARDQAPFNLGSAALRWRSINDVLFFASSSKNIGLGTQNPTQQLDIDGGILLETYPSVRPGCNAAVRGSVWIEENASNTDILSVCAQGADGVSYAWRQFSYY